MKLKENYFDDDRIVLLESLPDGVLYSNILLKLYLKSLKYNGKLQLDENIPYSAQIIATLTRQDVSTVERALTKFIELGLVDVLENGVYYMSNIELLVGKSSTEGDRKRQARLALASSKSCCGQTADICPPEIELESEIDIEKENGPPACAYGRYKNVCLSNSEIAELEAELPERWQQYVERLSEYMASSGKHYQSHAATIRRWASKDSAKSTHQGYVRNYSVQEEDAI